MQAPAITIYEAVRGCHHGQMDCILAVMQGGQQLAYLDYSVFEDIPHIQMIETLSEQRRGYASRLVRELQAKFPDQQIEWGYMTPEGICLQSALPWRKEPTAYAADFDRLSRLRIRLKGFEDEIARLHAAGQSQKAAITAFYCLEGLIDQLAYQLEDRTPHVTILDLAA